MKNLKFKAWHKPTNRMFDVFSFGGDAVFEDSLDGVHTSPTLPATGEDCEMLQFISAKDWRGTEIYEDFIVVISKKDGTDFRGVVRYSFQMSAYFITDGKRYMNFGDCGQNWSADDPDVVYLTNLEVIGNVYENPDLLTVADA